jgi:hypothetical protein
MANVIRREGKLERENLLFAVNVHLKRLSGLEAHTTSQAAATHGRTPDGLHRRSYSQLE